MRSDVKHISKCGYNSLYYCQTHRVWSCPQIWSECAYKRKCKKKTTNKTCKDHEDATVIYDEKVYVEGCPLCELERVNTNLHTEINAFNFKLGAPLR